jgi:pyruvate ferredoxin oxidoreductase alpha subunit
MFNNQGGPLFSEIRSALCDVNKKPILTNYIYGLGGREISLDDIRQIFADQKKACLPAGRVKESGKVIYFGVRE